MISTMDTTIKEQFIKVISYSQNLGVDIHVDQLFDKWREAKRDIIEAWQGKLIYELPETVTFELSQEDKDKRFEAFVDHMYDMYEDEDLYRFLKANQADFFNNRLSKSYALEDGRIIPKGSKMVRSFKYFISNEKALYDLQTQASMIIQEDKIHGTLCFSVHPLDYLSSSENTHKWRSCHALDGDYRAGNLSYMLDSSTIICYLKTTDKAKLNNFPEDVLWNSKKWRMLMFLSTDRTAMFAGRQYPFSSKTALDLIQPFLLQSIKGDWLRWSAWYNDYIIYFPREGDKDNYEMDLHGRHIVMRYKIRCINDMIEEPQNHLHYNDLLYSSCYIPYYCWQKYGPSDIKFAIGADVPCLHCGKHNLSLTNSMLCIRCEENYGTEVNDDFAYCACCGRRTYREDLYWNCSIDDYVCPECERTECHRCEACDRLYYDCDITYDHDKEMYLCNECQED